MNCALADYGRVLLSRWRWIMWGVLLALVATTLFLVLRPPLYRTDAAVFVRTPGDVSRVLDGGDSYAQARARTYATLASSTSVSSRVVADLGLDLRPDTLAQRVTGTNPPGTALIDIAVSAPSAAEAQRTATVFLSEYAATVRMLESVPGSIVPRAELVVVDPPGAAARAVVFGASQPVVLSMPVVLLCAALVGLVLSSLGAVLWSIFTRPVRDPDQAERIAEPSVADVVGTEPNRHVTADDHTTRHPVPVVMADPDLYTDATPIGWVGAWRHRRPWRQPKRSQERQT